MSRDNANAVCFSFSLLLREAFSTSESKSITISDIRGVDVGGSSIKLCCTPNPALTTFSSMPRLACSSLRANSSGAWVKLVMREMPRCASPSRSIDSRRKCFILCLRQRQSLDRLYPMHSERVDNQRLSKRIPMTAIVRSEFEFLHY